jgi:hypothetical protein
LTESKAFSKSRNAICVSRLNSLLFSITSYCTFENLRRSIINSTTSGFVKSRCLKSHITFTSHIASCRRTSIIFKNIHTRSSARHSVGASSNWIGHLKTIWVHKTNFRKKLKKKKNMLADYLFHAWFIFTQE